MLCNRENRNYLVERGVEEHVLSWLPWFSFLVGPDSFWGLGFTSAFSPGVPWAENRGGEGRGEGERRGREKERRRRFRKSDSFMKSIRVLLAVSRLFPLTYEMF